MQEQLQGHKGTFGAPLARTLSIEESGRSSASLGTGLASDWRARLVGDSEDDGDSPASLLRFSMPPSESPRGTFNVPKAVVPCTGRGDRIKPDLHWMRLQCWSG